MGTCGRYRRITHDERGDETASLDASGAGCYSGKGKMAPSKSATHRVFVCPLCPPRHGTTKTQSKTEQQTRAINAHAARNTHTHTHTQQLR